MYVVWQDDDEAGGPRKRGRARKVGLTFGSSGALEGEPSARQCHVPSARAQPGPGPRAFQAVDGGSEVLAGYVLCLVSCVLCLVPCVLYLVPCVLCLVPCVLCGLALGSYTVGDGRAVGR
jgi:hypothetical protein